MTISAKDEKKYSSQAGSSAGGSRNRKSTEPRSFFVRFLFTVLKYGTLLMAILLITIGGVSILGDTTTQAVSNGPLFNLYDQHSEVKAVVKQVKEVINKDNSKYLSKNVVNLYIS